MTTLPTDAEVERLLAEARAVVMEATARIHSPRRSTRYRTTRNLIFAAAAAIALTGGTIAVVQATQSYIDSTVICYEEASLDSLELPAQSSVDGQSVAIDPIEACAAVWRSGAFQDVHDGVVVPDPDAVDLPVPALVACTLPNGASAVFPREDDPSSASDFCAALGLAVWDSD